MAKDKSENIAPEWSVLVEAQTITGSAQKMKIEPGAREKRLLAKRLGIIALDDLNADLILKRDSASPAIYVRGKLIAHVTQNCVITGEPVKNEIAENFEAWYADRKQALSFVKARHDKMKRTGQSEMPVLDESEDPEPIIDGKIDVGELTVQYLSLAIDPYPHAPGAELALPERAEKKGEGFSYKNPFAALKEWKDKFGSGENS